VASRFRSRWMSYATTCGHSRERRKLPALVVATNMETGEPVVFHQGAVEPAVLAFTAIPGIFPPVTIGDVAYGDGAMMSSIR